MKLGLVGSNGAGKSAVCHYLETLGFSVCSLSDIVRREATNAGLTTNREHLIQTGTRLKEEFGEAYLAQESVLAMQAEDAVVYDSVRHPAEAAYLVSSGVVMVAVDAPIMLRYQRVCVRQNDTDFVTFETFKEQDDWENLGKGTGQNISETRQFCNYTLNNSGDLESLHLQIDHLLLTLGSTL